MSTKSRIDAAREYYETHSAADEIDNAVPGNPAGTSPMSGYSVRLPTEILDQARKLAAERGMTTGAWLREAIEQQVAVGKARESRESRIREYGMPTIEILYYLAERCTDRLSPREAVLTSAIDPALTAWTTHMLRERNAAHRHDLNVDALISGLGVPEQAITTKRSEPGKNPATIKVSPRTHRVRTFSVRTGNRTVLIKDSTPTVRRRRRSIT